MTSIPLVLRRASALTFLFAAFTAHAAGLPDTGQIACYDDTAAVGTEPTTHPGQDCSYGRDVVGAAKTGEGAKGLDYTKIANNGSTVTAGTALGAGATDWACTQDNITGLMWEVKTTSGLRSKSHTYTWYNSTGTTNGGNAGTANGGTCSGGTGCDTEKFVADVNALTDANRLCSYTGWRMPTVRELLTLVLLDGTQPSIDPTYFPNTDTLDYWSASSDASDPTSAWVVSFRVAPFGGNGGVSYNKSKSFELVSGVSVLVTLPLRLVRGGPF